MLKYCVGIDVSKNDLQCSVSVIDLLQKVTVKSSSKFANTRTGFMQLHQWITTRHKHREVPLVVVMEATGIYYEQVAMYLFQQQYALSVVLPNKAKKYLQSTGLKSKNDQIDAQGLSRMGAEQHLELWQPMDNYCYELRELTRQHQSLQELKTSINNQLHAAQSGMCQHQMVIEQLKALMNTLDGQLKELETAIKRHIDNNGEVKQKVNNICKIKGVGILTIAVILAETNAFALFNNSRQLVSYGGYDVVENQSGNHKGKTKISKKGNSRIRRAMHMPAFCVVRYEQPPFVGLFNRTLQRHGQKMKSYVAVQKKLLVIIYALWKHNTSYELNYKPNAHTGEKEQALSSLPGLAQADPTERKNSASLQEQPALHKVNILSNDRSLLPLCQ
jgi:transposase